jgi:hypothetical protein
MMLFALPRSGRPVVIAGRRSILILATPLIAGILLVGCELATAPVPAGAIPLVMTVANASPQPARLVVSRSGALGDPVGVAQPDTIPPGTTVKVRFLVPPAGDWAIWVNGGELIGPHDLQRRFGTRADMGIDIDPRGQLSWWCRGNCP